MKASEVTSFGDFRVVRPLGQGGMGNVWEVVSAEGSHFALKSFAVNHGAVSFLRRRFLSEGKLLSKLSHPRLVRVYDLRIDKATNVPYFVMNLVLDENGNATSLEDLRKHGKVTEDLAERWYADICGALEYCHSHGVIHRDVKLNNILLDASGHAVLSDFGVSRIFNPEVRQELQVTTTFVEGETTGTRPVMGTYWYLAPEVRRGAEATCASDWYALGVTFFRLLTGMWYEPGTDALELLAPYDPIWRKRLESLLNENPEKRIVELSNYTVKRAHTGRRIGAGLLSAVLAFGMGFSVFHCWHSKGDGNALLSLSFDETNRFAFCACPIGTNGYRNLSISVTRPYWLGKTPVTRRQWFAVRGEPLVAWEGGEDAPMTCVSREDVLDFCILLNRRFASALPPGYEIRLPTLAEWRLAYTRGKTVAATFPNKKAMRRAYAERGWFGQSVSGEPQRADMRRYYERLNRAAPRVTNIWSSFPPHVINPGKDNWARVSSQFPPVPVGLKPANELGLYDLLGNCSERVYDTCSTNSHHWGKTEWGVTTTGLYAGQGLVLTNPVERTGSLPLMVGTCFAPDLAGDRVWSADFDRLPHLGFRLCIGPKMEN